MTGNETARRLRELEDEARRLASRIGVTTLPPFGRTDNLPRAGGYYVDFDGLCHWVFVERGQETEHRVTHDKDELLYWLFEAITLSMAAHYEVKHRVKGEDFRRVAFAHQLELLSKLSEKWKIRGDQEHREILKVSPFCDTDPP